MRIYLTVLGAICGTIFALAVLSFNNNGPIEAIAQCMCFGGCFVSLALDLIDYAKKKP